MLAFTSHLPQLLSIVLANTVMGELRPDAVDGGFSRIPHGGGLRDMTRLAKSDPLIWRDILASNGENIRRALDELQCQIDSLRSALSEGKLDDIQQAVPGGSRNLQALLSASSSRETARASHFTFVICPQALPPRSLLQTS